MKSSIEIRKSLDVTFFCLVCFTPEYFFLLWGIVVVEAIIFYTQTLKDNFPISIERKNYLLGE